MRLAVIQRQRVDHAAARKCQARLRLHPGQVFGQPQRLVMRTEACLEQPRHIARSDRPKGQTARLRFHLKQRLQPDHAARSVPDHGHLKAAPQRLGLHRRGNLIGTKRLGR
jgi:hypothetical protein